MIQNNVNKWNQESKSSLDERIFFGKVMGMAKKVTLKAVKKCDVWIFEIFQQYLNEFDENDNLENGLDSEADFNSDENETSDDDFDDLQLQNPIKKPKKGRPKGTKRIKMLQKILAKINVTVKFVKKLGIIQIHAYTIQIVNANLKAVITLIFAYYNIF